MSDIVERLRDGPLVHERRWSGDTHSDLGGSINEMATHVLMSDAADEITRLRAEVERLTATVAGLNETLDAANDMMADKKTYAHAEMAAAWAEVERLTKERDEARRTVEDQSFLIVESIQDHADRDARIREEGRREGIEEAAGAVEGADPSKREPMLHDVLANAIRTLLYKPAGEDGR